MRVLKVSKVIPSVSRFIEKTILLLLLSLSALSDSISGQNLADLTRPISVRWFFRTESATNITPAADDERTYLALTNGSIVSLRLTDGGLSWKSDMGGAISAAPAVD